MGFTSIAQLADAAPLGRGPADVHDRVAQAGDKNACCPADDVADDMLVGFTTRHVAVQDRGPSVTRESLLGEFRSVRHRRGRGGVT